MGDAGEAMTLITVGGVTFQNSGALDANGVSWLFSSTKGWFDGPPIKVYKTDRPREHGSFTERNFRDGRPITVSGSVHAPSRALASAAQMTLAGLLAEGTLDTFTVTDPDQGVMSAQVKIEGQPLVDWYQPLDIDYQLTFYAPDPMRYGAPVSVTTGFPVAAGGLEYDLYTDGTTDTGFLEYGAASTTGRVVVSNPGNADVWPQYEILGPVPVEGFEILRVGTGDRLRYVGGVATGSRLVLDSATGVVAVDGYADRSGLLTVRDWFAVPAKGSVELAFVPLGAFSTAQLTATVSPGFW